MERGARFRLHLKWRVELIEALNYMKTSRFSVNLTIPSHIINIVYQINCTWYILQALTMAKNIVWWRWNHKLSQLISPTKIGWEQCVWISSFHVFNACGIRTEQRIYHRFPIISLQHLYIFKSRDYPSLTVWFEYDFVLVNELIDIPINERTQEGSRGDP